jgi:anthranilate synthase component 1
MIKLYTHTKTLLSDTKTPTGIFMALRDVYEQALLLESSDYNSKQNHYSYLCFNPIASIQLFNHTLTTTLGLHSTSENFPPLNRTLTKRLSEFREQFAFTDLNTNFCAAGLFGYSAYDTIEYFEDIKLKAPEHPSQIPTLLYHLYSLILVFNHCNNSLHLISHAYSEALARTQLQDLLEKIKTEQISEYPFRLEGSESPNQSEEEFIQSVNIAKQHCHAGDVFQLVLSRRFSQGFKGDDFNLYRALKNTNPSPYLFYFDSGKFRLLGSSPEAQLVISDHKAKLHPIAGTYKRSGNDWIDLEQATELLKDEKENSEHMMLVDLARNDLSKHCFDVKPNFIKQIQMYSHVIHLVSEIEGNLKGNAKPFEILADSSPAGTLSGAPKYKAMQLIDQYEPNPRGFYGGSIGYISNTNTLNHAIMIRTFLSKDHVLYYQAGAGIVNASNADAETKEIYNKIGALKVAMKEAQQITKSIPSHNHETISA